MMLTVTACINTLQDARERTKKLANLSDELECKAGVFYYVPAEKYEYAAAVISRAHAPFHGTLPRASGARARAQQRL